MASVEGTRWDKRTQAEVTGWRGIPPGALRGSHARGSLRGGADCTLRGRAPAPGEVAPARGACSGRSRSREGHLQRAKHFSILGRRFNQNAVSTGVVGGGGSLPRGVAPARGACSGLVKSQGGRTFPSLPGGLANASSAKVPRPVTSPLSLVK